ncbi:hypothetical protein FACS1894199_02750 [Bacteroidia bacterium]|nr:hypothetical protein FACS1894199_02750 [Bacteroidia bacterium]
MAKQLTKGTEKKVQLSNNDWRKEQLRGIVAQYTTLDDLDAFWERNQKALDGLIKGQSVSDVMTGFRAKKNPEKAYDARLELIYTKKADGNYKLKPHLHFKQNELIISNTLTLKTANTAEVLHPKNYHDGYLEFSAEMMNGRKIDFLLNTEQLDELHTENALSQAILDKNSKYSYEIQTIRNKVDGSIGKLTVFEVETLELSPQNMEQLKENGRLDHTLKVGEGKAERHFFVAVDRELNRLAFTPVSIITNTLNSFKNIKLTDENKAALIRGEKTPILMPFTDKEGKQQKENVLMYFDPVRKNMKIEYPQKEPKQEQKQEQKTIKKVEKSKALLNVEKATQTQAQAPARRQKQGQII